MHSVALIPNVPVHGSIVVRQFAIVLSSIRTRAAAAAVVFVLLPHLAASLDLPSQYSDTVFFVSFLLFNLFVYQCLNSNFQLFDSRYNARRFTLLCCCKNSMIRNRNKYLGHSFSSTRMFIT